MEPVVTEPPVVQQTPQYDEKWVTTQSTMESSVWNSNSPSQNFNVFNSPKTVAPFTPDDTFSSGIHTFSYTRNGK